MTKISDILDIRTGYSDVVRLKEEFRDEESNLKRMANYRPIEAHRIAFQRMAEAPFKPNSKRCFILSGSYGTGKSHLCLMVANYFNQPSTNQNISDFFDLYKEAEEDDGVKNKKAEILKNRRKEGRYLVAICDYELNDNFDSIVLRAIKDALQREGIDDEELNSIYSEAINKIEEWANNEEDYHYNSFKDIVANEYSDWTITRLKKALSNFNREALKIFKEIHKEVTTTDFTYSADNLIEILKELKSTDIIKENYRGLLILFDEFDYQLQNKRISLNSFQKFGEMCEESFKNNFPMVFIATTHRSFTSYTDYYNQSDFKTVSDRIDEIAMETNGIEDIIGAIVNPQKNSAIWKEKVEPNRSVFNQLATKCGDLNIFDWLTRPKLRNNIIINIYPMHPLATYCLTQLALDLGSNNRSVFKFFASKDKVEGSYYYYANNNNILDENGKLNLYTVDLLFNYFSNKISSDNVELRNTVKEIIRDYETTMREFNKFIHSSDKLPIKNKLYKKIIRIMSIYRLSGILNTFDNIKFGLNIVKSNRELELKNALKTLTENRIIFKDEEKDVYEFKKSDALDINQEIKDIKYEKESRPDNLFEDIDSMINNNNLNYTKRLLRNNKFLEAKRYNSDFAEDKRFKYKFITLKEFESNSFFEELEEEIESNLIDINGYEGICLIVVCETEDEIKRAKEICKNNNSKRILVLIPKKEIPIFNLVHNLKAALSINTENFSTQDNVLLSEKIKQDDRQLRNNLKEYLNKNNTIPFTLGGDRVSSTNDNKEAIDIVVESIYRGCRNLIKHKDLNSRHKFNKSRANALKEAVNSLLNFSKNIVFNIQSNADSGDIRYLRRVFFDKGIIEEINRHDNKVVCKINRDINNYNDYPALKDMIEEIKTFNQQINLIKFTDKYIKEYGLSYKAIILFMAFIFRYYRDAIMIIPDITEAGYLKVTDYQTLCELIYEKKKKNAVINYRKLDNFEKEIIKKLIKVFDQNANANTVRELYELMEEWYMGLDRICKVKDIYKVKSTIKFINKFDQMKSVDPRQFILDSVKSIYGYTADEWLNNNQVNDLIKSFKKDKENIEDGYNKIRRKIFNGLKEIFSSEASTEDKLMEEVKNWYKNLDEVQRNLDSNSERQDSRELVNFVQQDLSFEDMFLERLAKNLLGSVKNWTKDRSKNYLNKIRSAKNHIENICLVKTPNYNFEGNDILEVGNDIYYRKWIKIIVKANVENSYIYLTSNGKDPRSDKVQRIEKKEKIEFDTTENKKIKICAKNKDGKYSKVIEFDLNNRDKKYEPVISEKKKFKQEKLGTSFKGNFKKNQLDYEVKVTLPKDKDSLKLCIKNIIESSKDKYSISNQEVREVLEEYIKQL